ncbi:3782_t:CDS:2, partial [Rhizophagus irregularis]
YVVYNMYTGNFRAPFNSTKANNLYSSYCNYLKKYCRLKERPKLSDSLEVMRILVQGTCGLINVVLRGYT